MLTIKNDQFEQVAMALHENREAHALAALRRAPETAALCDPELAELVGRLRPKAELYGLASAGGIELYVRLALRHGEDFNVADWAMPILTWETGDGAEKQGLLLQREPKDKGGKL